MSYSRIDEEDVGRCLECGNPVHGRSDKKFCDDLCRGRYHASKTRTSRRVKMKITATLNRNYEILASLVAKGVRTANVHELDIMGFNRSCVTGHYRSRNGHEQYSCFDIIYYQSSSKIFNIHRLDEG